MLNQLLSSLDLTEEETKTYLTLLEVGPITVGNLTKKLGIPRSSLYGFLARLQDKGLVGQSQKWGVKTFYAESPEKISMVFQQKIDDLSQKQTLFKQVLPELQKYAPTQLLSPKFQLYEGEEGLKHVLKDMLLYSDMETHSLWPIKAMIEILSPEFFHYLNKQRIKNNLSVRAIWPHSQVVDIKTHPYLGVGPTHQRELRIAPKDIDFSMGYWVYGNKAAFISSRKESFGFIIESPELVKLLLTQFEILWQMSKPLEVPESETQSFLDELKQPN